MYRHITLRFTNAPLPLVEHTKRRAVRIIGHPLTRSRDMPLAKEYLFLVRGTRDALDDTERLFAQGDEPAPRIDCAEPGARVYQGRLELPTTGPLKGLLGVLRDALGTVLEHEPLVIERGIMELRLVTIPTRDSALRLRAIEQHAAEAGLGLQIPAHHPLTAPTVVTPRGEVLDLMEWETMQAIETAGCYQDEPVAKEDDTVLELSDALGIPRDELADLVARAERRLLREAVHAWRMNIRLATPPQRPLPLPPAPEREKQG